MGNLFSTFLVISPSKLNKMVKFLNGQELFVSCLRLYLWKLSLSIQNSHLFLIAAILRFNMAQKKDNRIRANTIDVYIFNWGRLGCTEGLR